MPERRAKSLLSVARAPFVALKGHGGALSGRTGMTGGAIVCKPGSKTLVFGEGAMMYSTALEGFAYRSVFLCQGATAARGPEQNESAITASSISSQRFETTFGCKTSIQ